MVMTSLDGSAISWVLGGGFWQGWMHFLVVRVLVMLLSLSSIVSCAGQRTSSDPLKPTELFPSP